MRRLLAPGLAIVLAFALFGFSPLKGSLAHPQTAYACTWYPYKSHSTYKQFWDVYRDGYNYLNVKIATQYSSDCSIQNNNYFRYVSSQWFSYSTYYTVSFTYARIWVCGTYEGQFGSQGTSYTSPAFEYYVTCGPQADNLGSEIWLPYNGSYVSQYVNQG